MKWNKKTDIFALMVGHGTSLDGTWDCGCVYGKYTEAELMLPIVKVATKMLRKSGVRVITDADEGNNRNMKSSVAWANKVGAKLYMSIHCDFAGSKINGIAPQYKSDKGKEMAETVAKVISKKLGENYAGLFKRTTLYELNATQMPAVVFETGCIKTNLDYLKDYQAYGKALAKGICKYIGVDYVSKTPAEKFNDKFEKILDYANDHHFKYVKEYDKCGKTWERAKELRRMNCQMALCYALQEVGILPKGQSFYCTNNDKIVCQGGLTMDKLKKIFEIDHPHKSPKQLKMKKGDVVGYGKPYGSPHTMEYCKKTSKGTAMWNSWSKGDIGKKTPHVKKSYTNKKISTIMRLK